MTGTIKPIDGTNPYGSIKNVPSGTLVDEAMLADAVVFFQRLAAMAGVTLNDLPDNAANGFQFYDSFDVIVNPSFTVTGFVFNTSGVVWGNKFGTDKFEYKIQGNMLFLDGVVYNSSPPAFGSTVGTLPVVARPAVTQRCMAWHSGTAPGAVQVVVNTDGTIVPDAIIDGNLYFGGANIKLDPDSY